MGLVAPLNAIEQILKAGLLLWNILGRSRQTVDRNFRLWGLKVPQVQWVTYSVKRLTSILQILQIILSWVLNMQCVCV